MTKQINELSKKTLGSYIKKASADATDKGFQYGTKKAEGAEIDRFGNRNGPLGGIDNREKLHKQNGSDSASQNKLYGKFARRLKGVSKATDRLTKEEHEVSDTDNILDALFNEKLADFTAAVADTLNARAHEVLGDLKSQMATTLFADPQDENNEEE